MVWSSKQSVLLFLSGLLMVLLSSTELVAQERVVGQVLESRSGDPVVWALVWLQTPEGDDLDFTFTSEDGSFAIILARAGAYRIAASRQGYESVTSDTFYFDGLAPDPIELRMSVRPIEIEGVEVEAQGGIRLEHQATYAGLYRRALDTPPVGRRRVYLREALKFEDFRTVEEFVRQQNVPGLGRSGVVMAGGRTPPAGYRAACDPHVVWAGFEAVSDVSAEPIVRAHYLNLRISDMEGIELYGSAAEAPMGVRPTAPDYPPFCGLIVLWPRREGGTATEMLGDPAEGNSRPPLHPTDDGWAACPPDRL